MRKFFLFSSTFLISALIAGVYGIIHDQITYTISPEYFTRFKYIQFNANPEMFGGNRITVGIIGFLASWWMGAITGLVVGGAGLFLKDHILMKKVIIQSLCIVFVVTFSFAWLGLFVSKFYLIQKGVDWWLPENLQNKSNFVIAGTIHNFSYAGGVIGLFISLIYFMKKQFDTKINKQASDQNEH